MRSYGTCLSLTGLFHLAQYSPGLSIDTGNGMVIKRGEEEWGAVEEGTGGIKGNGRRLDLGW